MSLIVESVQIEHSADKHQQREDNDNTADNLVDYNDAAVVELIADFVNKPCKTKPPQQGSAYNAEIAYTHV